jgi:hypothetical protein
MGFDRMSGSLESRDDTIRLLLGVMARFQDVLGERAARALIGYASVEGAGALVTAWRRDTGQFTAGDAFTRVGNAIAVQVTVVKEDGDATVLDVESGTLTPTREPDRTLVEGVLKGAFLAGSHERHASVHVEPGDAPSRYRVTIMRDQHGKG